MSRRWPSSRSYDDEQPASPEVSRLLVLGFLIAAAARPADRARLDRLELCSQPVRRLGEEATHERDRR